MRRWLSLPRVADAWNATQCASEQCAQPVCGTWHFPRREVSTAALQPDWLEHCATVSASASAAAGHSRAGDAARELISSITQRVSVWLAAPKRKVLFNGHFPSVHGLCYCMGSHKFAQSVHYYEPRIAEPTQ